MKAALLMLLTLLISARFAPGDPARSAQGAVEFRVVDIFIDPRGNPLAAYQLDWRVISQGAKIVGIEGGGHPAFKNPPYYDPKAIQQERVVLAAFNVSGGNTLPRRKVRVATIHLQIRSGARRQFHLQKAEAVTSNGRPISIEASSRERSTQ